MKEILFKAKRTDNGEWVEGYYVKTGEASYIVVPYSQADISGAEGSTIEVDESTVCQFTGLLDKNGRKIWENDICNYFNPEDKDGVAVIKDDYVSWISGTISKSEALTLLGYLRCGHEWEVIGNVFDNPELLRGASEPEIERD